MVSGVSCKPRKTPDLGILEILVPSPSNSAEFPTTEELTTGKAGDETRKSGAGMGWEDKKSDRKDKVNRWKVDITDDVK